MTASVIAPADAPRGFRDSLRFYGPATTKSLFRLKVTHASFDIFPAAIVCFNAETQIAHLVFK